MCAMGEVASGLGRAAGSPGPATSSAGRADMNCGPRRQINLIYGPSCLRGRKL
jgi:hypothetical protein